MFNVLHLPALYAAQEGFAGIVRTWQVELSKSKNLGRERETGQVNMAHPAAGVRLKELRREKKGGGREEEGEEEGDSSTQRRRRDGFGEEERRVRSVGTTPAGKQFVGRGVSPSPKKKQAELAPVVESQKRCSFE